MSPAIMSEQLRHSMQCMEIWGGNRPTDTAVSMTGLDAWVYSMPHEGGNQGGDIHYVSMCGGGRIVRTIVADVAGHGITAGELSATLRRLMRKYINTVDQSRFARALNREFSALETGGRFATALLATYLANRKTLILCNAGHPPPLWYRAASDTWQYLSHDAAERAETVSNLPLGIIESTDYYQFAVPLGKGDLVLIYTDALIEAQAPGGDMLGDEGLLDMVRSLDATAPDQLSEALLAALDAYRGGAAAGDDTTMLLIHHNAANPHRQSLPEMARTVGRMFGVLPV